MVGTPNLGICVDTPKWGVATLLLGWLKTEYSRF